MLPILPSTSAGKFAVAIATYSQTQTDPSGTSTSVYYSYAIGVYPPAPHQAQPQAYTQERTRESVFNNVPKGSPLRREIIIGIRDHFYQNNLALAARNPDGIELSFREFYVDPSSDNAIAVITKVTGNMRYLKPLPMLVIVKRQPNATWKLTYWISLPLMDQTLEQGLLATGLPPQFLQH